MNPLNRLVLRSRIWETKQMIRLNRLVQRHHRPIEKMGYGIIRVTLCNACRVNWPCRYERQTVEFEHRMNVWIADQKEILSR